MFFASKITDSFFSQLIQKFSTFVTCMLVTTHIVAVCTRVGQFIEEPLEVQNSTGDIVRLTLPSNVLALVTPLSRRRLMPFSA